MTQEVNNEMDLLLRRLSRSASDSSHDGNHLDADELSSYAENALPAAARARYTEHLAECANCRKLIAQLSSSIGAVTAVETARVSAPSALRKFLASLLSPMVLRYAVPALGLIVVAVIGLTVLRRNERPPDSVAQVIETKAPTAPSEQAKSTSSGTLDKDTLDQKQDKVAATTANRPERSKETQPAPPPANAQSPAIGSADVNQAAPTTKAEQPQVANEPPAPKPTPATDENQKKIEARKQEAQVRTGTDKENAYTPSTDEARSIDDMAARAPAKTPSVASMAKVQRDRLEERGRREEKDKSDADTRSVAGRRFRRERGIWIDTAYDSSRSTVNLTRDSEQYRALVADEPAIKIIAEQLDGEIIVVWKGRTYRIR